MCENKSISEQLDDYKGSRIPYDLKLKLCQEFKDKFNRLPKDGEEIHGFTIGRFIRTIKDGKNKHARNKVEKIFGVKLYDSEKCTRLPNGRFSDEDKIAKCLRYKAIYNKIPMSTTTFEDFQLEVSFPVYHAVRINI